MSPERGRSPVGEREPRDRKLSFSPLPRSWDPPSTQVTAQPIGAFEVPKSKRICSFHHLPLSHRILKTDCRNSTSYNSSNLLPLRSRHRLWLRSPQTRPNSRTCISKPLHQRRNKTRRPNMLRAGNTSKPHVHSGSRWHERRCSPHWSHPR